MAETKKGPWDKLKWLAATAGSMGGLIPGWAFFNDFAPPLFESVSLVTGGVALAIVVVAFRSGRRDRPGTGLTLACIVGAVLLLVAYGIARDLTTVPVPGYSARLQVGFHLAAWSLTPDAQTYVAENNIHTLRELVNYTGYDQDLVKRAWTVWSIYTASALLIVLFTMAFLLWAYGFGLLARTLQE